MLSEGRTNAFRRLTKIAQDDPKMFRLNIDKLWLIEHWNMANSASWLVKNDITCVDIIFIHTCDTIFIDLLLLSTAFYIIKYAIFAILFDVSFRRDLPNDFRAQELLE